jgi:uncharacterized membrane protein YciS (DUF1049 family)
MLVLSIAIQLCLFFIAVTVSLWFDQLVNRPIADQARYLVLYLASSAVTLALLLPWLIMGWVGVRRELKLPMFLFLLLALLYMGCWSVMLDSTTFRWTFVTWRFFLRYGLGFVRFDLRLSDPRNRLSLQLWQGPAAVSQPC